MKKALTNKKRLSVERLESRTVLSATNLFATTMEIAPEFEDRFVLRSQPVFFASELGTQDRRVRDVPANRFELPQQIAGDLEVPQRSRVGRTEASPIPRLGPGDTLDPDAGLIVISNRSALVEWRASEEAFGQLDGSPSAMMSDLSQLFAERQGDEDVGDLGLDQPEVEIANRDRIFSTVDDPFREGSLIGTSGKRPQQLLRHDTHGGDEFNALAEPSASGQPSASLPSNRLADELGDSHSQQLSNTDLTVTPWRLSVRSAEQLPVAPQSWLGTVLGSRHFDSSLRVDGIRAESYFAEPFLTEDALTNRRLQSEGGLAEFDFDRMEQIMADRRSFATPLPGNDFRWYGESRRTRDSFWLEFSADVESQLATDAAERLAEEVDAAAAQVQIADADSQVDSEEGGMIELIAAVYPKAEQPLAQSNGELSARRPASDKVRMDTGVGLFQVFEIAISPQRAGVEADPAAADTVARGTVALPLAERAAANSGDSDAEPIGAASLSALLIAGSLYFDRRQRRDDKTHVASTQIKL